MRLLYEFLFYAFIAAYVLQAFGALVYTVWAWFDLTRIERELLDDEAPRSHRDQTDHDIPLFPE